MIHFGDVRTVLPRLAPASYDCVVTSPPYWGLRDYQTKGQIGLEPTPWIYLDVMVEVFRKIRRVLKPSGSVYLNMGDSFAGDGGGNAYHDHRLKVKDMMGLPWRLALMLQDDGWYLRRDIIWSKPNAMPESARDRPTTAHEYIFILTKNERYYFNHEAVKEKASEDTHARVSKAVGHLRAAGVRLQSAGVNPKAVAGWANGPGDHSVLKHNLSRTRQNPSFSQAVSGGDVTMRKTRSVWTIPTQPYKGAHFATFPEELARRCLKAGCPPRGRVLDPFGGSGTTAMIAAELGLKWDIIEINRSYPKRAP